MADLSLATRLANALNREYIDAHGWEALQVDRVAPLTNALIEGMIGADAVKGESIGAVAGRALWATLAQTGFRKAEVSLGNGATFGPSCLTRHNLRWRIGGVETADPTPKQLRNLQTGDMAIIIPPKSKCDQFGLEWGQAPIYLRFHADRTINAARLLRDLELRLPRRGLTQRESTALFTRDDGAPLTSANLDAMFKRCLSQAGVPNDATARYSPHSFRRFLACALKAQGAADSTIQALLRWKTAESLKLYSIINDETYADLVDGAGDADVSSVRTNALPRAELLDAAGRFHVVRRSLDAAAATAEATAPADDVIGDEASSAADSDESEGEQQPPQPPPMPPPATRKRARRAAATPPPPPPPLPPLTIGNAVGRHAMVPAHVWPEESCSEHDGAGWEVTIRQADKHVHAVLVHFVHARDTRGRRFASEWLKFDAVSQL